MEVTTIVVGISIALAADAAWEDHVDRRQERLALGRLYDDFGLSAELLDSAEAKHIADQAALEALLGVIASAGDPPNSYQIPDSILWNAYRTTAWRPPLGAVTSLINSGEIRLIRSDSLRAHLTSWLEVVSILTDKEDQVRRHYEAFQLPLTYQYVPYVSIGVRLGASDYDSPSRLGGDYRSLLDALPFENAIDWRVFKEKEILSDYGTVATHLELILGLAKRELGAS